MLVHIFIVKIKLKIRLRILRFLVKAKSVNSYQIQVITKIYSFNFCVYVDKLLVFCLTVFFVCERMLETTERWNMKIWTSNFTYYILILSFFLSSKYLKFRHIFVHYFIINALKLRGYLLFILNKSKILFKFVKMLNLP